MKREEKLQEAMWGAPGEAWIWERRQNGVRPQPRNHRLNGQRGLALADEREGRQACGSQRKVSCACRQATKSLVPSHHLGPEAKRERAPQGSRAWLFRVWSREPAYLAHLLGDLCKSLHSLKRLLLLPQREIRAGLMARALMSVK